MPASPSPSPQSLPQSSADELDTRAALKEELAASPETDRAALDRPYSRDSGKWPVRVAWSISAVLAMALGASVTLLLNDYDQISRQTSRLRDAESTSQDLEARVSGLDQKIKALRREALTSTEQPDARGTLYLDKADKSLFVVAHDVKPAPEGKTYQLWINVGGKSIAATSRAPDASGRLLLEAPLPEKSATTGILITLEPEPLPEAPSMPVQFAATLAREKQ